MLTSGKTAPGKRFDNVRAYGSRVLTFVFNLATYSAGRYKSSRVKSSTLNYKFGFSPAGLTEFYYPHFANPFPLCETVHINKLPILDKPHMIRNVIDRLDYLCNIIPGLLSNIDDSIFNEKIRPDKWSKKEIIGHLIDSATNNHQRFVRGQFEDNPSIVYDQNEWNTYNFYQQIGKQQVIDFWTAYNKQLLELIRRIPTENLQRKCLVGNNLLTLDFLINDYVEHLEHHLRQVVLY